MYTEGMLQLMPKDVAAVFDFVQVSSKMRISTRAMEAFEEHEGNEAAWTRWAAGRKKAQFRIVQREWVHFVKSEKVYAKWQAEQPPSKVR
jgi:hypothetical protein